MSVKKNLTLATVTALLAIPAFGATNTSHALHIPSVTVHADESSNISKPSWWYDTGTKANVVLNRSLVAKNVYQNPKGDYLNKVVGTTTFPTGDHVHVVSQGTNGVDLAISDSAHPITDRSSIVYSVPRSDATAFGTGSNENNTNNDTHTHTHTHAYTHNSSRSASGDDTNPSSTTPNEDNDDMDSSNTTPNKDNSDDTKGTISSNKANTNTSNGTTVPNENSATNSNTNGSTQYTSKNSLPQTGETNNTSRVMAMGAVALGASASMMALSMARKHRHESELNSASSEPTVENGDGKPNEDKAGYHMIMSDTFADISKDLKQM